MAAELKFTISSVKPAYLPTEPVIIDFAITNSDSAREALVNEELALEKENVSLYIAKGRTEFKTYHPGFVDEPSRPASKLSPSASIIQRQIVLYNASEKDFAFTAEGAYRISAVYHRFGTKPDIKSNTISIQVTGPSGNEKEALLLFKDKKIADLIMNLDENASAITNLETLMLSYAGTIYGKYAQFYLARRQTRQFFSRKPNYQRAVELYRDLIKRDPSFPLTIEANYSLGQALLRTGDIDAATQHLEYVSKTTKQTTMLRNVNEILNRIKIK